MSAESMHYPTFSSGTVCKWTRHGRPRPAPENLRASALAPRHAVLVPGHLQRGVSVARRGIASVSTD